MVDRLLVRFGVSYVIDRRAKQTCASRKIKGVEELETLPADAKAAY